MAQGSRDQGAETACCSMDRSPPPLRHSFPVGKTEGLRYHGARRWWGVGAVHGADCPVPRPEGRPVGTHRNRTIPERRGEVELALLVPPSAQKGRRLPWLLFLWTRGWYTALPWGDLARGLFLYSWRTKNSFDRFKGLCPGLNSIPPNSRPFHNLRTGPYLETRSLRM